jgi:hypothetical protein
MQSEASVPLVQRLLAGSDHPPTTKDRLVKISNDSHAHPHHFYPAPTHCLSAQWIIVTEYRPAGDGNNRFQAFLVANSSRHLCGQCGNDEWRLKKARYA